MAYLNLTDEKILTVLMSAGYSPSFIENFSIRQISLKSKLPYSDTHKSIRKLKDMGIVRLTKLSNSWIVAYNFDEITVGAYIEGLKAKIFLSKHLNIQYFLKLFEKKIPFVSYSIIIFGSYAKGKSKKGSDIDMIILTEKDKIDVIEKVYKTMNFYSTLKIDAHFFTYKELIQMLKATTKVNIATESYKNHVILSGAENYLKCLKKVQNENK